MAKGADWELVCSEISRPYAIETFRLQVANGWIYCNAITRRACLHAMNFRSLWFLYPIGPRPAERLLRLVGQPRKREDSACA